jgi:hypothetical protein
VRLQVDQDLQLWLHTVSMLVGPPGLEPRSDRL